TWWPRRLPGLSATALALAVLWAALGPHATG
ncbi:DUF3325 domain-containing protein, partial [Paracidovorax avenae]